MEENIHFKEIDNFLAEMVSLDDDPLWDIDGYSAGSWQTDTDDDLSDKKSEPMLENLNDFSKKIKINDEKVFDELFNSHLNKTVS